MAHLKTKVYVFFEKDTGKQVFATDNEQIAANTDKSFFKYKEFFLNSNEVFEGDYDTGKVVDRYVKPLIYEQKLREETEIYKQQHYPLDVMVYMILNVIVNNKHIELTPEFKAMVEFLENCNKKLFKKIEIMKNQKDITFISLENKNN